MKLLKQGGGAGESGFVKVVAEESEDLWHAYNLIAVGDKVATTTLRKVQRETSCGGSEPFRVRITLEVQVEAIEVDSTASVVRIRGRKSSENEYVKLGSYHTLELDLQRPFTITKESWDSQAVARLKEATDPAASADVAAVLMQEGLAHVCLIGRSVTTIKAKIETSIPRKRGAALAGYDKALAKFFEYVLQAVLRHVDFSSVRCLILASPGFTKDQFAKYMFQEATRRELRTIIEHKSLVLLAHCSSAYKHALKEVLGAPEVLAQIRNTKAANEVKAMEDFYAMLTSDSTRAFYGPGHVEAANERLAIHTLLISDSLFRNPDVNVRRKYVALVESVKENGGEALVFSSLHVSGEQLDQLTGVAAILRFPLPDVEEMEL